MIWSTWQPKYKEVLERVLKMTNMQKLFILWMLIGGQGKEEYYDCHMHPALNNSI